MLAHKDIETHDPTGPLMPRSTLMSAQSSGRAGSKQSQLKNLVSAQIAHDYRRNRIKHSSIDITEHSGSSMSGATGNYNQSLSPEQKKTVHFEQKSNINGEGASANFRARKFHQKSEIYQQKLEDTKRFDFRNKRVTSTIANEKNIHSLTLNSPNYNAKSNSQQYQKNSTIDASHEDYKLAGFNGISSISSPKNPQRTTLNDAEKATIEPINECNDKNKQENGPRDPQTILNKYSNHLTPFEKPEILNYKEIYYFGENIIKIEATKEQDYEDERNDYKAVRKDHIAYRYQILDILGKGSFGQVLKVLDLKTNEEKALKIIRNQPKFHFQAKIEIKILKFMQEKHCSDYNIIQLRDFFIFRGHQCLVFDILSMNLYEFLKMNKFKGLSLSLIRRIAIQVLYALRFMRKYNIIHCDLKPENILLRYPNKSGIRVIDFGSSCFGTEKLYTYIQSRFYRSPEIILGLGYDTQIDMWSFGCLLAELYLGYPLFPGDSEADQLFCMMEMFGKPSADLLQRSQKRKNFFEEDLTPKTIPNSKGKIRIPGSIAINSVIRCRDTDFLDLIVQCLVYDPAKRMTPEEALYHTWILQGLPENLQAQHLKIVQQDDSQKPVGIISNNAKREAKEIVTIEEIPEQKKEEPIANSNHDDSFTLKKKNLQLKINDNFTGEDEPELATISTSSKYKPNIRQNSALFVESQNASESIDNKAQRKQPVSTKNSNINFISNIYYFAPFGMQPTHIPKKPLSGARTPKKRTFMYHSSHNSQDNIEAIYQPYSDKRDKSLSIDKKSKNGFTPKTLKTNLMLTVNRKPEFAYRKPIKANSLFPDIKKA